MAKPKRKKRVGIYKTVFAEQARKLCELGSTDKKMAEFFEVNIGTISTWKNKHIEFKKAVIIGKDAFDCGQVQSALLKRALGGKYEESTFTLQDVLEDGVVVDTKEKLVKRVVKDVAPDVKACLEWLYCRNKDKWGGVKENAQSKMLQDEADRIDRENKKARNQEVPENVNTSQNNIAEVLKELQSSGLLQLSEEQDTPTEEQEIN